MTTVAAATEIFPSLGGGLYAYFFDVDGTLAAIQLRPDAVSVPATVRAALQTLFDENHGALALISGRSLCDLDRLMAPLHLPLAGVHGAERRDSHGQVHCITLAAETARALQRELTLGMAQWPGSYLEAKGMAFALHYRQARQYENQILQLARAVVQRYPDLALQPGKCVVEIKPQGTDKGSAINAFMNEAPFYGRIPVFVGDDLTDEQGFHVVNARHGISVKVGEGTSCARYRLKTVQGVWAWLEQLKKQTQER